MGPFFVLWSDKVNEPEEVQPMEELEEQGILEKENN